MIYAGIDEAGYGPMFGPFVVACAALRVAGGEGGDEPPMLWRVLSDAVCATAKDRRGRIAVNDSKKLFSPSSGVRELERGVLSFLHAAGCDPMTLDELLRAVGHDEASRTPGLIWYADESGGPALPSAQTPGELAIARSRLRRGMAARGVGVAAISAAIVYEDRFNQLIESTRSKARATWTFVAQHLWRLWCDHGEAGAWVVVDRQGGRKVYHPLLEVMFEGCAVKLVDESDDISSYVVSDGGRRMVISFETDSEQRHLPTALASMAAKYARELLMTRFNAFWRNHAPALKPTQGYVQDGRRFLRDIEPVIDRLGIERSMLVRSR